MVFRFLLPLSLLSSLAGAGDQIIAQEYFAPGISAKDGSPIQLYLYEKYDRKTDPNQQARSGRIVLVLHGATTSGRVNYDVQVPGVSLEESFSLMDQFAQRGYDVWTLDYQNYGRSDHHDCGLCVNTEAASRDIEKGVEFILGLRKVERLHLIGWSWGGETGGLFAQRHPGQVNRLVLYAPVLDLQGYPDPLPPPETHFRTNDRASLSGFFHPTARVPEAVDAYVQAALEVDPVSPNGVLFDWRTDPQKMDPRQLTMPTLLIGGVDDDRAPLVGPLAGPNARAFFGDLAADDRKFVVVPTAGHGLFMEQRRGRWYEEVLLHLEHGNK